MFAREPPSSSDPTKRPFRRISSDLEAFRQLLLQIGGANIAGADRAVWPLPSSLTRSLQLLARSSRTAARDPNSHQPGEPAEGQGAGPDEDQQPESSEV